VAGYEGHHHGCWTARTGKPTSRPAPAANGRFPASCKAHRRQVARLDISTRYVEALNGEERPLRPGKLRVFHNDICGNEVFTVKIRPSSLAVTRNPAGCREVTRFSEARSAVDSFHHNACNRMKVVNATNDCRPTADKAAGMRSSAVAIVPTCSNSKRRHLFPGSVRGSDRGRDFSGISAANPRSRCGNVETGAVCPFSSSIGRRRG